MKAVKKTVATGAALLAVLLVLTGCSGGGQGSSAAGNDAAPEQGVFEFQTPRYGSDSGELLIRLPEGLFSALGGDAEPLVTEAVLTPRELDGAKYCAVDLSITYAGEGEVVLTKPTKTEDEWREGEESRLQDHATNLIADYINETGDTSLVFQDRPSMEQIEKFIDTADSYFLQDLPEAYEAYLAAEYQPKAVWSVLSSASPASELDEAAPEPGSYITSDNRLLTIVDSCAASPADDGGTVFTFPVLAGGDVETLAEVKLSIMKSGTITVTSSEVDGFVRDTDGNWIAD
ncbi:hypothetical protein [Leucobacter chromiireducens]|uniref:Lipoprotein n=1 Tax=Leucobacter chromiireducens subsp. chromiireducens TaxID=660067 RepID=A0ABS1SN32_9MICO|nr:hypothetical protein [Leucobacter chromiireducens]MBL3689498.1 hypothetical protein [Leucobacter chromiireducens subsp. chromiireducens]